MRKITSSGKRADYTTAGVPVFKHLREEIDGIMARDPAARSRAEVALCYPGFHAIVLHRVARYCWDRRWHLMARAVSQIARALTGIEIHPGATIGRRFFIDHGMGVVIGETAEIGDDVMLYHGVTLGGTSLNQGKRHPTLESGVIVGAGAKVLGAITIGRGARVGANAVVVADVAPGIAVVGIPAKAVVTRDRVETQKFMPYGTPCGDIPDPVARALNGLLDQVSTLRRRVEELESERGDAHNSSVYETSGVPNGRARPDNGVREPVSVDNGPAASC
ncbi:serine O-acetyltransferase [Azospirillum sp. Vi22]|nr:serine O-acetyltransferase EpsC [Azospirillum baldaniorum]NUB04873.1 serine O-acetyltransferase [Azospirillum baldaniorum]TWA60600.1 serine O-acetyltransferase [Azospirillum baldaniorum]